jgi:hypothetical protein
MNKNYQHSNELEERYFCMDIAALKQHDEGFKTAYDGGSDYELTIKLMDLFVLCPRKRQRRQQYGRLSNYLASKGITLRIISRKHDKTTNISKVI